LTLARGISNSFFHGKHIERRTHQRPPAEGHR
jgi:hypothetical protein